MKSIGLQSWLRSFSTSAKKSQSSDRTKLSDCRISDESVGSQVKGSLEKVDLAVGPENCGSSNELTKASRASSWV